MDQILTTMNKKKFYLKSLTIYNKNNGTEATQI